MDLPKHADNPRYYRDETGQWWYQPTSPSKKSWLRIRSTVKQCSVCGEEFLWHARSSHNATKNRGTFCTVQCANRSPTKAQGAPKGEKHINWNGGRSKARGGYVLIRVPDHPDVQGNTRMYVMEHRLVMEQHLGRYLLPTENVHHLNGIRDDNRIENLELWAKCQLPGQRVKDLLAHARWILETYGPVEDKI